MSTRLFVVHHDMSAVLGCLRAAFLNFTVKHADREVYHFFQQLQGTIDQIPVKDILVVQGDWNAKVGRGAQKDWGEICCPHRNFETNERVRRL